MEKEVIFNGISYKLSGTHKNAGDIAEDFEVINSEMETIKLYDMPKGVKIISSCSSINTPMCAMQNKRLNAEIYISAEPLNAITVSVDLPFTQAKFSFEEDVEYINLFSDHINLNFGMKYGVLMEQIRMLSRALFVVDSKNIIRYVEYVYDNEKQFNYIKAVSVAKELMKQK